MLEALLFNIFRKFPKLHIYYTHIVGRIVKYIIKMNKEKGVRIMDEKWDYLIVLDAFRYDYFEKLNKIKGQLQARISKGSCTLEWLVENFNGYYNDVIYVSANPFIANVEIHGFKAYEHFFKVVSVWHSEWDNKTGTVHPERVVNAALKIKKQFPNKRMIIHFIQPHAPYIGKTRISNKELKINEGSPKEKAIQEIWRLVRNGDISLKKLKMAYEDNCRLVLKYVEKLLVHLDGKIIITSDHGESFGEWLIFGHPRDLRIKELVKVPWLVISKEKRNITNRNKTSIKLKIHELKKKFIRKRC